MDSQHHLRLPAAMVANISLTPNGGRRRARSPGIGDADDARIARGIQLYRKTSLGAGSAKLDNPLSTIRKTVYENPGMFHTKTFIPTTTVGILLSSDDLSAAYPSLIENRLWIPGRNLVLR